jgi:peptidoglycan hydrolase-like protein with peptidoglycan-binding domain
MINNPAPPFPLPLGHTYGPNLFGSLMIHDGSDWRDAANIRLWGSTYKGRIRRPMFQPGERFTGHYQRAVAEIQRLVGLPATGLLGASEWPLPWTLEVPPARYVRPGGEHAERQRQQHKANVRDYWRRYSKFDIHPGSDPEAPPWFPGRPFGQFEYGEHVKPVQQFFGIPPNGRFTPRLAQKVRGFQRVNDLPVSGIVDARTASYMQAAQDDEDPPPSGGGSSFVPVGGATNPCFKLQPLLPPLQAL